MRVYEMDAGPGFDWLTVTGEADLAKVEFDSTPRSDGWTPVEMVLMGELKGIRGEVSSQTSYFPWFLEDHLMLRDEAIDKLGPILSEFGEILDLSSHDMRLAAFNSLALTDALDEQRSEIRTYGSELMIDRYVFDEKILTKELSAGAKIFKPRQSPKGPLLFTDAIIDEFAATGLGHLHFHAVWDAGIGSFPVRSGGRLWPVDRSI